MSQYEVYAISDTGELSEINQKYLKIESKSQKTNTLVGSSLMEGVLEGFF